MAYSRTWVLACLISLLLLLFYTFYQTCILPQLEQRKWTSPHSPWLIGACSVSPRLIRRQDSIQENMASISIKAAHDLSTSELLRYKELLSAWPTTKIKAAVYILANHERVNSLIYILSQLETNFISKYRYPVIIFHELPFNEWWKKGILKRFKMDMFFQLAEFEIPQHVTQPIPEYTCSRHNLGYRHMCRFHSIFAPYQEVFDGLEYVWRLDTDSELLADIPYDLFVYMKQHQYLYGYMTVDKDPCTCKLWDYVTEYIKDNKITPTFFWEWPESDAFYNNFEISHTSVFRSMEYNLLAFYLDRLGGIYYWRWGDASIRTIGVSLVVPRNRTHKFSDIAYRHKLFTNLRE